MLVTGKHLIAEYWDALDLLWNEVQAPIISSRINTIFRDAWSDDSSLDEVKFVSKINQDHYLTDPYNYIQIMLGKVNRFYDVERYNDAFLLDSYTCFGLGVLDASTGRIIRINHLNAFLSWHAFNRAVVLLELVEQLNIERWINADLYIAYACELTREFDIFNRVKPRITIENLNDNSWMGLQKIEELKSKYFQQEMDFRTLDVEFMYNVP